MTIKKKPLKPLARHYVPLIKDESDVPQPWTPEPYQLQSAEFILSRSGAGLFLDPGLGKTAITLAAIKTLVKQKKAKKILIVAPLRVCHLVWPAEIAKWKDFNHLTYQILHGPNKQKALDTKSQIYLINPEGLPWLLGNTPKSMKLFERLKFDVLVVDELTKFKNQKSQRFKLLKKVLHLFKYCWGLTGSPASNGLINLFSQCYILDGGAALGKYITQYRSRYFELSYNGFSYVIRPGMDAVIYEKIKPFCLRLAAEDHIEMPKLITHEIIVELPHTVMEFYNELESELIAQINDNLVVASNAAAASIKCRQIANGAIYTGELSGGAREYTVVHDEKLDALENLIEELQGQPLLVAYEFEHDLARILKRFPHSPYIGKGVTMTATKKIEHDWNTGKIPLLFGQPQSMGHGLNLQSSCCHVAWFTPCWDLELSDQFVRRVWRRGNPNARVFNHIIIAKGTVDRLVIIAQKRKMSVQQALFDAIK